MSNSVPIHFLPCPRIAGGTYLPDEGEVLGDDESSCPVLQLVASLGELDGCDGRRLPTGLWFRSFPQLIGSVHGFSLYLSSAVYAATSLSKAWRCRGILLLLSFTLAKAATSLSSTAFLTFSGRSLIASAPFFFISSRAASISAARKSNRSAIVW